MHITFEIDTTETQDIDEAIRILEKFRTIEQPKQAGFVPVVIERPAIPISREHIEKPAPEPEKTYTADDIKTAITGYAQSKGLPAASALLQEFGVKRATELKPEQYAAVISRIQELSK